MIRTGNTQQLYYTFTDNLGSVLELIQPSGVIAESYSFDAWGRRRNPANWSYTNITNPTILTRGFTGHEHLDEFGLINMNARLYDPYIARMLGPDKYVQDPANAQNYNRYSYCWNNPLKYTDPDGNIIFTALAVATGQWWALPMAIGADVGMWSGGTMANGGEMNPFKWNYDAKTLGYMAGGALVGAASGGAAGAVATSGMVGAKTAAIVTGSFINSVGTHIYTGGKTDVSVSFGFGSFNLTNGTADGIWNWSENSGMENLGYTLGALANLSDITNVVDGFTHWEDKMAAKSKAYMDKWTKDNPNAVVDPTTVGKNGGRSYPSYFGKNPKILGTKQDYMGMVDNWSWKEYGGYLHDAEYIAKGIEKGAKYLLGSYRTYGADIRLASRTLFLGLKHFSPFEITGGVMQLGINAQKLPYGWIIKKPH